MDSFTNLFKAADKADKVEMSEAVVEESNDKLDFVYNYLKSLSEDVEEETMEMGSTEATDEVVEEKVEETVEMSEAVEAPEAPATVDQKVDAILDHLKPSEKTTEAPIAAATTPEDSKEEKADETDYKAKYEALLAKQEAPKAEEPKAPEAATATPTLKHDPEAKVAKEGVKWGNGQAPAFQSSSDHVFAAMAATGAGK